MWVQNIPLAWKLYEEKAEKNTDTFGTSLAYISHNDTYFITF